MKKNMNLAQQGAEKTIFLDTPIILFIPLKGEAVLTIINQYINSIALKGEP